MILEQVMSSLLNASALEVVPGPLHVLHFQSCLLLVKHLNTASTISLMEIMYSSINLFDLINKLWLLHLKLNGGKALFQAFVLSSTWLQKNEKKTSCYYK